MKNTNINANEVALVLAAIEELRKHNLSIGSIAQMDLMSLEYKLENWYKPNVLGMLYDEDYGWYDPETYEI